MNRISVIFASTIALGASLLDGCSDSDSIPQAQKRDFTITASLGALVGASCTATFTNPASTGDVRSFGPFITQAPDGTANITGIDVFPVTVTCRGGSYYDEASGTVVERDANATLQTLIPDNDTLEGLDNSVAVTPFTDAATALFNSLPVAQRTPASALGALNSIRNAISPSLGDSGDDLLSPPQVVNADNPNITDSSFAAQYAAYLAGFARAAAGQGLDAALLALRQDVADGDGQISGSSATLISNLIAEARVYVQNNGGADTAIVQELADDSEGGGTVSDPTTGGGTGASGGS